MRLINFVDKNDKIYKLLEYSTGSSNAAMIASVPSNINGVISRQPNLFGYIPLDNVKKRKKKTKKVKP